MKRIGIIFITTALFLLLGVAVPLCAQRDKGDQQDQHEQQAKPGMQQRGNSPRQNQQKQARGQQGRQQQHGNSPRQGQQKQAKGQQRQQRANRPLSQQQHRSAVAQRNSWQEHRAHSWESEHRTWQQRGGYNGYRIPDDRFRVSFGRSHWFRIYSYPVIFVGGYPRFRYGGFWFSLVDPWPEYWSDNWYENDYVYIDYAGDGYYLYNRSYPRDRIAITVFLN